MCWCVREAHLYLFEHFRDGFTVEFLTGLLVGRQDLLYGHIVSYKRTITTKLFIKAHICYMLTHKSTSFPKISHIK